MRGTLTLYRTKNYESSVFSFENRLIVTWSNGIGKTNMLEAFYLGINGVHPPGRKHIDMVKDRTWEWFVRLSLEKEVGIDLEYSVSFAADHARTVWRYQTAPVTRKKYTEAHGFRAILFSPIEMNLLYLWPSLRRDFLDEMLLLAHDEFSRVRREYFQVLRSRNLLLKSIQEWEVSRDSLDTWDSLFVQKAAEYARYRFNLLDTFEASKEFIVQSLGREGIFLISETKIEKNNIEESIRTYLQSHREKDILIGHTCIGPHLDDFRFELESAQGRISTDIYLSRWENKAILLALKFLSIKYIEEKTGAKTILLLDDMVSELDSKHSLGFLESFWDRPFILTGHMIPENILQLSWIKKIHLE